jgi:hypothetical protein
VVLGGPCLPDSQSEVLQHLHGTGGEGFLTRGTYKGWFRSHTVPGGR